MILACLGVLTLTALVYAPTLTHEFVWDDLEQVRDNAFIRSWSSFPLFWQQDILALSRQGGDLHSNYYRPLFYVEYLLLYKSFGLNRVAWHAAAILVHALTSCFVLLFIRRLGLSLSIACMCALLFAVHPAHGESVSWIAAAFNDPPAAAFILLGLSAHITWLRGRGLLWLALGSLGFAGALCLKESGLSMLLLVPLVTWFIPGRGGAGGGGRPARERVAGIVPYFGLAGLYFFVRSITLGTAFGVYEGTKSLAELAPTFPLLGRFYVRLLIWPIGLSPSYPLRYVPDWSDPRAWGSLLSLALVGVIVLVFARRHKTLLFCALWIVCCIWPVFNIRSFLPTYLAHQRYLYLAALGLCLAIAWGLERLVARPVLRYGLLVAVLAIWSASNLYYDRYWATDTALWSRISEVDPHNPAGFDWLGSQALEAAKAATRAGRSDEAARKLDEAEARFRGSIAADPAWPNGYQNLAVLLHTQRNRPELALPFYESAIERFAVGGSARAGNLAQVKLGRATCLASMGRKDEALVEFTALAQAPPYPPTATVNAAVLAAEAGRADLVEQVLMLGLSRHPADPGLLRKMTEFLLAMGRPAEALPYARRFEAASPDVATARALLGAAEAAAARPAAIQAP